MKLMVFAKPWFGQKIFILAAKAVMVCSTTFSACPYFSHIFCVTIEVDRTNSQVGSLFKEQNWPHKCEWGSRKEMSFAQWMFTKPFGLFKKKLRRN